MLVAVLQLYSIEVTHFGFCFPGAFSRRGVAHLAHGLEVVSHFGPLVIDSRYADILGSLVHAVVNDLEVLMDGVSELGLILNALDILVWFHQPLNLLLNPLNRVVDAPVQLLLKVLIRVTLELDLCFDFSLCLCGDLNCRLRLHIGFGIRGNLLIILGDCLRLFASLALLFIFQLYLLLFGVYNLTEQWLDLNVGLSLLQSLVVHRLALDRRWCWLDARWLFGSLSTDG